MGEAKGSFKPCDPQRRRETACQNLSGMLHTRQAPYAYGAAKAGLHQLTRMLASDLTARNVTVNAIAPGFFPSDMTAGFFTAVPGLKEQMEATIPAHRLGSPEDIGGAVIFLCSRAGSYLSGAILPVEGGLWST